MHGPKHERRIPMDKDPINRLPIFGKDIVDDWSWDREEEEMRESSDDDSSESEDQD